MRIATGVIVLAMGLGVACAEKTAQTPAANAPAAGAGARAAARVTPEDIDARMKTIGATQGTLRMKLMNNEMAAAATDAQTLATAFADVERYFAQNNKQDAVAWAQTAVKGANDAAAAAKAGNATAANAAVGNMMATCKQCHTAYREGTPQTGYHIKAG